MFSQDITTALKSFSLTAALFATSLAGESMIYEDVDGLVCFEAEHYKKAEGSFVPGKEIEDREGYSGDNWMYGDDQPSSIYFDIKINKKGRYFLFSRTYATGHGDNGFMVYIDGKKNGGDKMYIAKSNRWDWETHIQGDGPVPSWDLDTGMHELKYAMRDNYHRVDKVVLLNESMFTIPTHSTDGKFLRPNWGYGEIGPDETPASVTSSRRNAAPPLKVHAHFDAAHLPKVFALDGSVRPVYGSRHHGNGVYVIVNGSQISKPACFIRKIRR